MKSLFARIALVALVLVVANRLQCVTPDCGNRTMFDGELCHDCWHWLMSCEPILE